MDKLLSEQKPYDPQQMIGRDRNPYDWDNAKRMKEMWKNERKR
jgi:hypothetical protein